MHRSIASDPKTAAALKDLQRIPGIGPSLARDFVDLGVRSVADLRGRNPERLYEKLIATRGVHQDRCVLYTFRCAEANPDPERFKWWNWKDQEPAVAGTSPRRGS